MLFFFFTIMFLVFFQSLFIQTYFGIYFFHILFSLFFCQIILHTYFLVAIAVFLCYLYSIVLLFLIIFLSLFDNKCSISFYIFTGKKIKIIYFPTDTPRQINVNSMAILRRHVKEKISTNFNVISTYFFNVILMDEKSVSSRRTFFNAILMSKISMSF